MSGMARASAGTPEGSRGSPSRAGIARVRLALAGTVTVAAAALSSLSVIAGSAKSAVQPAGPLALAVTSLSPSYATPRHTITVTGTVRNLTGEPATGLT